MLRKTLMFAAAFTCCLLPRLTAQDFRLQVAAYAEPVPSSYFTGKGLEGVIQSIDHTGIYRYFLGAYNTREEAEVVQKQLEQQGSFHPTIIDLAEQRVLCGAGCPYFKGGMIYVQDPGQEATVRNIYFDFGKYSLDAESKAELDKVYAQMKENPDLKLKVLGFTDGVGSAKANIELATSRARTARNYLINKGVRADRMFIKVFGEAAPAADNEDYDGADLPDSRKMNRRVVLALVDDKGEVKRTAAGGSR